MPSYDIIPLASDLLDYTIQRVKQKEAEYKPVKAYIMVGDQLVEKLLYDKVKDDGKPHFPKSQTFHLCAELQDCAVRILKGCEAANGRYFETEYEERLKDLDGVLIECQTMEQLINLSYGRKYITGDQCHYWAELVRPVRQKAFNWRKSDGNRAAALREAKAAQELAKMGQMALQIAEALLDAGWLDDLRRRHPDAHFIFVVEGVLMYFYEKQVKTFLHHVAERFGGGELWFDVCGTMMSRHGVKPDSLREHEAQIRSGLSDGRLVEQWEPRLRLLEQANYMKFFRPRWGFFFGQILGRMTRLCYKFSSMLGYEIVSNSRDTAAILHER